MGSMSVTLSPRAASRGTRAPATVWLDPLEDERWDELVAEHGDATAFHTSAWARVLHTAYGYRPQYLALQAPTGTSLIPVAEVVSLITGRRGVSLPFTDTCPPLLAPGATLDRGALEPLLERGRERGWRYLELRGTEASPEGAETSAEFLVHEIPLAAQEDVLWERISTWGRRMVRRAAIREVEVTWSRDVDAIERYFAMHVVTRQRHGVPPQPRPFFHAVHEHFLATGRGLVGLAHHDGAVVAGVVVLHTERHAMIKFGASYPAARSLNANHLLLWETIRRCASDGLVSLDLGRTDLASEGLAEYKRGYGAVERRARYHRVALAPRRSGAIGVTPTAAGEQGWGRRVFRRMPIPLLSLCGRLMYRHVG
jgi:CelD/BcsL family acetyltransferase involved in cellulose biosynthesis